MECNKWEETGLLYLSGEVDEGQSVEFENHLFACSCCNKEKEQYAFEKQHFFSEHILCECTPDHLDKKIISLCSKPVIPTSIGLFSFALIKRVAFSLIVFALGAGAGGYFTFAYYHAKTSASYAQAKTPSSAPASAVSQDAAAGASRDSLRMALDTAKPNTAPALLKPSLRNSRQAASPSQGIITVDVKKEQ